MPLSLDALIRRTQLAIDAENDPRKLRTLQASLAAHLATKAEMDDDDEDEDEDKKDDEDGDESAAKKAAAAAEKAKGKAEAAKHRAKAAEHKAKAAEAEEAAKAAEAEDDEESEESAAAAPPATHDAILAKLAASVAEIKQAQTQSARAALIAGARKIGAITKAEATWLADLATAKVEGFLEMRARAGLVVTDEESLIRPKHAQPGSEESLSSEAREVIDAAVKQYSGTDAKAYREKLVKNHLAAHAENTKNALNGAGRY